MIKKESGGGEGARNNFRGDKNISIRDEAAAGRKLKAAVPSLRHSRDRFQLLLDSKHRDCR